nr:MAG TPA: hypothetical protein [Caudoviricetes sp.]
MEKEKVLNLLERFEEFLAERKAKKSNIHIALEITIRPDGSYKHYIFALDEKNEKNALAYIKGFEKIVLVNEVETFGDVLEVLERA